MQSKIIEELQKYSNIAILGFGKEGRSTYNYIRKYDTSLKLTILDAKDITLEDNNVTIKKYNNTLDELLPYDLIIKTPGIAFVSFDQKRVDEELKSKITSQMELLLKFNRKNVIGITGTKGKSTTSTLLYNVLKDQLDNVFLVGNIGIPVFDKIDEFNDGIIVAEMSSHQLEFIDESPHVGIILNLFVDHLDHTGSVDAYHNAKINIIRYQDEDDYAIYDKDNKFIKEKDFSLFKGKKLTVSNEEEASIYIDKELNIYAQGEFLFHKHDIITQLQGDHNLKNIMFVLMVAKLYNLDMLKVLDSIRNFKPLEHRMEYFGTYEGIAFYEDAIATIPEATINACNTLKDVDTLIFGGMDRNIDYYLLIQYLQSSSISHFICMPETGYKIAEFLDEDKVIKCETLEEAVDQAFKVTAKGKVCILSPAASSYNQFANFEEKGNRFKELVKNHVSN